MVTVCPQCKAVYRFGVMEFHETMSKIFMECHDEVVHDMQWSMLLIFTDKVSTGNVEMNFNSGETPKSLRFYPGGDGEAM